MTDERTIEELRTRLAVLEREGKARVCHELGGVQRFPRTISYMTEMYIRASKMLRAEIAERETAEA